ncbi:alpha/beta hydrolase [Thalassotalea sp. Y01]|nr:alpha/beta hydrolase [Thalassotalea sp. Y01]
MFTVSDLNANKQCQEAIVNVNGIDIAYQLYGNSDHPTLVLIHGLGAPLTAWPMAMVEQFVERGFQVLLFDNRDIGYSQQLEHLKIPNLAWLVVKSKLGLPINVPYKLEDMMLDTIALVDHLNIKNFHLIGASMGGMIAQLLAIYYPHRVKTLTSIMSTTGNKTLPKMSDEVKHIFSAKPDSNSEQDIVKFNVQKWRIIGSPDYPAQEHYLNNYVKGLVRRGLYGKGTLRQMLAVMAGKNREKQLAEINVPTLVLHGGADPLIRVACGEATAQSIRNATLKIYPGMGHDFPVELLPSIVSDISGHIQTHIKTKKDQCDESV